MLVKSETLYVYSKERVFAFVTTVLFLISNIHVHSETHSDMLNLVTWSPNYFLRMSTESRYYKSSKRTKLKNTSQQYMYGYKYTVRESRKDIMKTFSSCDVSDFVSVFELSYIALQANALSSKWLTIKYKWINDSTK